MLAAFDKLINRMYKCILYILILLGLVMLIIAWAHVFYRYVLNDSLTWSEELLKIMLVWFCLLSTTIIAAQRGHVSIVVFKEMMPKSVNKFVTFVAQLLMLLASLIILVIGIQFVAAAGVRLTPALRMPYRYAFAAIPASFAILSFYELRNTLADLLKGAKTAVKVNDN